MARLGARSRRPAETFASAVDDGDATQPATRRHRQRQHQQMGTRVMAWWCARVVAPVRRACRLAVAAARARVRKAGKHSHHSLCSAHMCTYIAACFLQQKLVAHTAKNNSETELGDSLLFENKCC
jgi:hypothetical protein